MTGNSRVSRLSGYTLYSGRPSAGRTRAFLRRSSQPLQAHLVAVESAPRLLHPEKGRAPREGWWRSSLQPAGHPTNPFSSGASSPPQGLEAVSLPEALFYLEKILEFEFVALVCLR